MISNVPIPYVKSAVSLGVLIDGTLFWTPYISNTLKKMRYTLNQIKQSKTMWSKDLRKQLVQYLIVPIFDYCCLLLTNLTLTKEKRLQTAFNTFVRLVLGLRRDASVTPYFIRLKWLKIALRRKYFTCCLVYKLLCNGSPSYLASYIIVRGNVVFNLSSVRILSWLCFF